MKAIVWVIALVGSASADVHRKPQAPVTVQLESAVAPGGFTVTMVAVPTRAVPAVELTLGGKTIAFPATAAGQRRQLVVHVPVAAGGGADVVGSARLAGRNKAAILHVGAALQQAPKQDTIRVLPDGRTVREAR